jgi:iron complex transport system permease protein
MGNIKKTIWSWGERSQNYLLIIQWITVIFLISYFLLSGLTPITWRYALSRRIPLLLAMVLGAGSAALSTVIFQTIAENPVITPGIMGVESVFVLSQTLIVFFLHPIGFPTFSPVQQFLVSTAVLGLYSLVLVNQLISGSNRVHILLLTGVVISSLFSNINSFLQKIMDPNEFSIVQSSVLGSLVNVDRSVLWLGTGFFLVIASYLIGKIPVLDVLSLGRDTAVNLGIHYHKTVKRLLISSLILVAVSTSVIGPFTFLGLLIVSTARLGYQGISHKKLFQYSITNGIILLLGGQLLVQKVFQNALSLPMFINVAGGLGFLLLITRRSHDTH